eukprot:3904884-Prymnesium_polylepis.1
MPFAPLLLPIVWPFVPTCAAPPSPDASAPGAAPPSTALRVPPKTHSHSRNTSRPSETDSTLPPA